MCAQSQCIPGINIRVAARAIRIHSEMKDHFGKFWLFSLHPVTDSSRAHTSISSWFALNGIILSRLRRLIAAECWIRNIYAASGVRWVNCGKLKALCVCVCHKLWTNKRRYNQAKPIDDDFRSAITWIECSSRTFYGIIVVPTTFIPI